MDEADVERRLQENDFGLEPEPPANETQERRIKRLQEKYDKWQDSRYYWRSEAHEHSFISTTPSSSNDGLDIRKSLKLARSVSSKEAFNQIIECSKPDAKFVEEEKDDGF